MNLDQKEIWFLTTYLETERAGSLRQERWCQVFLKEGSALRILNMHGSLGFIDIECNNLESFEQFRKEGIAKYGVTHSSVKESVWSRIFRKIKHVLMIDLYYPNVAKALWVTLHLLSKRTQPVRVMASSPAFSTALIGALLKLIHPEKMILAIDMRDAWALHPALGGIKAVKESLERWVLRRADFVSTVSIGLAEEFEKRYKIRVNVLYNVASHYANASLTKPISIAEMFPLAHANSFKVVYTGSTPENFYDLESFTSALAMLEKRLPKIAEKIQVVFIGSCDEVKIAADRNGISNNLVLYSQHMPNYQVRALQVAADALLFLGFDGEKNMGVVSTKFFEYLSLGRPILPINVFVGSDVDILLNRYCGRSKNIHTPVDISVSFSEIADIGALSLPVAENTQFVLELMNNYHQYAQEIISYGD